MYLRVLTAMPILSTLPGTGSIGCTWPWLSQEWGSSSPTTASSLLLITSRHSFLAPPLHCLWYQPCLHPHCPHCCPAQQCHHLYIFSQQQNYVWLHPLFPCPCVHLCLHCDGGHVLPCAELCHHTGVCGPHLCWSYWSVFKEPPIQANRISRFSLGTS